MAANEKPLATVIEATKRPEYYNPLAPPRDADGRCLLLEAGLDNVQVCRVIGKALAARAMLLLSDAKFDEAWRDLLALHRLGRHVGQGGCSIETLVGIALERMACDADAAYLERANLDAAQLSDCLKELQSLKPIPPVVDKVDVYDRCMLLEILQSLQRDGMSVFDKISGNPAEKRDADASDILGIIVLANTQLGDRAAHMQSVV